MASLKDLQQPAAAGVIEVRGVPIQVVYRPEMITPEFEDGLAELSGIESVRRKGEVLFEMLSTAVVSWDLKLNDSDTEPIAITREGLRKVPLMIQADIISEVMGLIAPDPKAAENSENGSLPAEDSEASHGSTN